MTRVTLNGVSKVYNDAQGTERAVDDLSMTIDDGQFAVIVGPSGCGKTTTLRMIAGLEAVTEGTINIGDREVQDLAPAERNVAMVFQNYALYPSMTGRENMAYGLKHAGGMSKAERNERVTEMAELLEIMDILEDTPDEMSGGQKQRVALGRAIVRDPDVFLLDEPLSNLDAKLRSEMRRELQRIHRDLDITTIYVTHDQKEAMTMSDRIAILNDGRLQQAASPEEAYTQPANRFVGEFLGSPSMNTVERGVDGETVSLFGQEVGALDSTGVDGEVRTVALGLRPEDIVVGKPRDLSTTASVNEVEYQGDGNFLFLSVDGTDMTVRVPASVRPSPEDSVTIGINRDDVYLFDSDSGTAVGLKNQAVQ